MRRRKILSLLSLLVVASMLLTACASGKPAADNGKAGESEPKVLKIRIYRDIKNMDPAMRVANVDQEISSAVFSGLVTYAPNSYEIRNDLAEKIEVSPDGKEITFKLREGVKFHKGNGEVTAEDVKYSFERFIDPNLKSPYKGDWETLDRVEVIDKYTGKIILKKPFAPLWHTTLPHVSGFVIPKGYVEKVGVEKFATDIVGTGPYYLDKWEPNQKVVLKRNPDYFGQAPYWDEIDFIYIKDDQAAEVALRSGEVDFSPVSLGSYAQFKADDKFKTIKLPQLRYQWIGLNVENPKLKDVNVRNAIRYAIDVPSIIQAAYNGQVEQETGIIAPGLLGYWKDAPVYKRDVAKAKEFLAKAGIKTLDLRIDVEDTPEFRTWAEVAQQNLKDVGINLEINPLDYASYWEIGSGDKGKNVELFTGSYDMQPDPSWATVWFTSDQVGVWNWMRWANKEFDQLHLQGLEALTDKEREEIYIKMQKLMDEAAVAIWIAHGTAVFAHSPAITPAVTPHGIPQYAYFGGAK